MLAFLLNVAGAAALLLWAVRMIRTGVERAFATELRRAFRGLADNPAKAALVGSSAAIMLQSATAVALLAAGFLESGTVTAMMALALIVGADFGSAVAAQILLLRAAWIVPLLILVGFVLFKRGQGRRLRQVGRVIVGLGLVFLALDLMRAATAPLAAIQGLGPALAYLDGDPLTAFLLGALLAWAMHSSVAAVLTFITFAAAGILSGGAALALVLGANLGGAAIPVTLTAGAEPAVRRIMLGNLLVRGTGAAAALIALNLAPGLAGWLGETAARQAAIGHLVFNGILVLLALPLLGRVARWLEILMPERTLDSALHARPSALDEEALARPEHALACASREILHMGEETEAMLGLVMPLFDGWDEATANAIAQRERELDRLHFETKLYLARLHEKELGSEVTRRSMDLATIATNLEAAGDIISDDLLNMARRLSKEGLAFSSEGRRELSDFHDRVLSNAQLALNVMLTGDVDSARQLVEEKDRVRTLEQTLQSRHLQRLRVGRQESVNTSNLHQETLRALKQINTAFTMAAYPIVEETGGLMSSRLS